jgi:hypothetical protein
LYHRPDRCLLVCRYGEQMKVKEEFITALPNVEQNEITVLMGGYRLDFSVDEARALVQAVSAVLRTMPGDPGRQPLQPDQASILAQIEDQVMSWAQITDSLAPPPKR